MLLARSKIGEMRYCALPSCDELTSSINKATIPSIRSCDVRMIICAACRIEAAKSSDTGPRRAANDIIQGLIHDVNPSQLSGASHRSSEALLDARRDTVTHRATNDKYKDKKVIIILSINIVNYNNTRC